MTSPAHHPESAPSPATQVEGEERTHVGRMPYDEYQRLDEGSDVRLEYVGGVVYAMSGGTRVHSRIAANALVRLHAMCVGTGCTAHSQGFKVRTPGQDEYVPDVFVECGPVDANAALYAEAPCVIVEVLSPSTARVDLNEKRWAYQEVPSLGAYLIIESEWRGVHRHWRDDAGTWRRDTIVGDGAVPLPCPAGGVLTLAEIYEELDLPPVAPEPRMPRLRRVREQPVTAPG